MPDEPQMTPPGPVGGRLTYAEGIECRPSWDADRCQAFRFDEFVARGVDVHVERLSDSSIWMRAGDHTLVFYAARAAVFVQVEHDPIPAVRP